MYSKHDTRGLLHVGIPKNGFARSIVLFIIAHGKGNPYRYTPSPTPRTLHTWTCEQTVRTYRISVKRRQKTHPHPGVLATKVGYLGGSNRLTCAGTKMGTQPAKVGHLQSLGVNSAKVRRFCATKTSPPPPPRSSLRGRTKVAKVGPLRARVKSAKVRPTPYVLLLPPGDRD